MERASKMIILLPFLLLLLLSCSLELSYSSDSSHIVQVTDRFRSTEHQFRSFIQKYNKNYATPEEYAHRLRVFAGNLARAAKNQILDPTAVHGVTPFFDLSEEEFERSYMGLSVQDKEGRLVGGEQQTAADLDASGLPSSFDWREKGAVTDVKMQVSNSTRLVKSLELLQFNPSLYFDSIFQF